MQTKPRQVVVSDWPPLPTNGVFPETLCTVEVAQLLRYDAEGITLERAKRNVQWLVRNRELPVFAKLGQRYLFHKEHVMAWLQGRSGDGTKQNPKDHDASVPLPEDKE